MIFVKLHSLQKLYSVKKIYIIKTEREENIGNLKRKEEI